jgi:NCS1 family nucleobase:cation symporter-1
MIIASCGNAMYGTTYWVGNTIIVIKVNTDTQNLWDFFNAVLDHNWNAGARTLVFLACLTQVYATFVSTPLILYTVH